MTDPVLLEVDGPVAHLRFTRPDLGNAVTVDQAEALRSLLEELVADPVVRVVVLTGSGSTFNVGAAKRPGTAKRPGRAGRPGTAGEPGTAETLSAAETYREQIPVMTRVVELLATSRLISIAAINGGCAGAGLALALACDLRYAATSARFNTAFLAAEVPGELGAIWFATRLVGAGRARELFLLPDRTDAASLASIGLVNAVVEPDALDSSVAAIAHRLAGFPDQAVQAMKANFVHAASATLDEHLRFEVGGMLQSLTAQKPSASSTRSSTTKESDV